MQNRPNSEGVASNIQELWAMTQEVKTSKQRATVGRFDVSEAFFHFLLFSMLF